MKRITTIIVILLTFLTGRAQVIVDNFNIGPYTVDYLGDGKVKYRLMEDIDLFDFFELKRDTTIIVANEEDILEHAFNVAGYLGSNRYAPKEIGIEGVWKQKIGEQLYFNGGLNLGFGFSCESHAAKRTMIEIGIPLQIELGKLSHQIATLYGSIGLSPTIYSTINSKEWVNGKLEDGKNKKSGFLIAPTMEFGGNIPVGTANLRIGVYGKYKINCTTGELDAYKEAGKFFLGAKIGIVL